MEYTSCTNEIYLSDIKNKYSKPILSDFYIKDNTLFFSDRHNFKKIDLNSLKLYDIDNLNDNNKSLYNKNIHEIHYIISKLVYINNNKSIINNINIIDRLLLTKNISQEETDLIYGFADYYFEIWSLASIYQTNYIKDIYDLMHKTILKCYSPEYNQMPNCHLILNYLKQKMHDSFNQGNATEKSAIRVKNTTSGTGISTEQYSTITGFANATLVLAISITTGITIAIISIYLGT